MPRCSWTRTMSTRSSTASAADRSGARRGHAAERARTGPRVLVGTVGRPDAGGLQAHRCAARGRCRMKVALVHDWLTGMRGGERCSRRSATVPPTPTSTRCSTGAARSRRDRAAPDSYVTLPMARTQYRRYLPLFPFAIERFDLDGCDLVISSSHCAAKAVVAPGRATRLLLPFADALRVDQFDAYFGPARVARSRAAGSTVRCWRGWRGGMPRRQGACTGSSPTPHVAAGSGDTIIAKRRSCIRLLTRSFSASLRSRRESLSDRVRIRPIQAIEIAIEACRRIGARASSATAPIASGCSACRDRT